MARHALRALALFATLVLSLAPLCAHADPINDEKVAEAAERQGDHDSALKLYGSALEGFADAGQFEDMARVAQALILLQISLGEIDAALVTGKRSRRLLLTAGMDERAAQIASQLGSVLKSRGEYVKAEESYRAALDIYSALDKRLAMAGTLMSLGVIVDLMDEPRRSADYYLEAGKSYMQLQDERGLMQSYASRGQALLRAGEDSEAEDAFRQALFLCGKLGNPAVCAGQQLGLSRALRGQERNTEALDSVDTALALIAQKPSAALEARAHLERGRVLLELDRAADALTELILAWEGFSAAGSINEQVGMADELIELARHNGRSDLAKQYTREADALNVSS